MIVVKKLALVFTLSGIVLMAAQAKATVIA